MTRGFVTFGSMHGLPKLNDQVLRLWAAVLNAVPNSRLFIYRSSLLPSVQPLWRQRCQAQGIDPGRVIMAYEKPSSGTHLDVYREMDIHLDSLPWNGHTTACEALWMGVPTVTLRGNRHSGRMSASMLHNVGLDQFIADSAAQYVSIAADAARDLAALGSLRQRLRKQMEASPLMDGARFTRELEAAFAEMARLAGGDAA
jgi:predicted O-linked N-acetylglucosamine transferase (SPINDLY family)